MCLLQKFWKVNNSTQKKKKSLLYLFGLDVTASDRHPRITGLNKTSSFCIRLHEVPMSRLVWEFCFTEASGVKVLLLTAPCSAIPASSEWPASLSSKLVDKEKGIKKPRTHASYFLGKVLEAATQHFHTISLVRMQSHGHIYPLGRLRNVFILGGYVSS